MKSIAILCALFASATLTFAADPGKPAKPPGEGDKGRPSPEERFKKLDTNSDGTISKEEFLASPRAQKDPEKARKAFEEKDKDKNGSLDKAEIAAGHDVPGKPPGGPEGKPPGAPDKK